MVSDEDMHDAYGMDSDDFYSGDFAGNKAGYDFENNDSDDSNNTTSHRQQVLCGCTLSCMFLECCVSFNFCVLCKTGQPKSKDAFHHVFAGFDGDVARGDRKFSCNGNWLCVVMGTITLAGFPYVATFTSSATKPWLLSSCPTLPVSSSCVSPYGPQGKPRLEVPSDQSCRQSVASMVLLTNGGWLGHKAVGLLTEDDMCNNEVGHNALGAGQLKGFALIDPFQGTLLFWL